jgi:hypothetical protein
MLTAVGWQAFGLVSGPVWFATLALGIAMLVFDSAPCCTRSTIWRCARRSRRID